MLLSIQKIQFLIMHKQQNSAQDLLPGGGDMGSLIRNFDWSQTNIGPLDKWPKSLQTILRLLLASAQPMFVWWGSDLIQFYNDAYRQILGDNGKHPLALGQKGKDCWQEIWPIIHPLILKIFSGFATFNEDQLIPLFRNGKLEPVYWTFAYTPIHNDAGIINGVFVTCNETTTTVIGKQWLTRQYNLILMQAPVAICIFKGKDHVIESANEKMLEFWGRKSMEEVIGLPVFTALPETADQGFRELLDQVSETGVPFVSQEHPVKLKRNGKIKQLFVKFVYQPLKDEMGNVIGIIAIADDITAIVEKRNRTVVNELKARIAIASAELGTYQVNLITNKVTGNKQFYKLINLEGTLKFEDYKAILYPGDAPIRKTVFKEAFVSGKLAYETRIMHKDKSLHWLKIHGKVIFDKLQKPVKLIGVIGDITQQKLHEEEKNTFLAKQITEGQRLQLFESVISHIKDAVIIIEIKDSSYSSHKIIYSNNALITISGFTKIDVASKTLQIFYGVQTNKNEWLKLKNAIDNKESCEIEVMSYKKNREIFWNNMCISPVIDSNGNYTHCIAVLRDVTIRKRKDKDLTLAIINTQEKERFQISAELHDNVNQILAGTLLSLGMAQEKVDRKQLPQIDQSIEYLHLAIKEIRRLSHWLAPIGLDDKNLVESFKKLLQLINMNNQFRIKFTHDKINNIYTTSNIQLNLYRILQEQITNILKHAKATEINITLENRKNHICLNIYDNGVGLNPQNYQGGIGLNNIKKRVELLTGNFMLKSSQGNGCELDIRIPLNAEDKYVDLK